MKYKLENGYTEKQKNDFIVEYNHNKGLRIIETDGVLYALEPWEDINDQGEIVGDFETYKLKISRNEKD